MFKDKIKLALVDDHPIVIEGLMSLFKAGDEPYDLYSFIDGNTIIDFLTRNQVDVVLLDIALPDANGIDICKAIKSTYPETIVIGLSNQAEQSTILQLLQSGASGFLLKSAVAEEILNSIQEALSGEIVMSKEVRKIFTMQPSDVRQLPSLTKREKQLLELLAQGKTTALIAEALFLSKFTVDTYRKNLLQKFEVKNTTELLMLLVAHKMI